MPRKPYVPRIVPLPAADPRASGQARCGFAQARLFDEQQPREPYADFLARTGQAKTVCRHCPIAEACFQFATAQRSSCVAGGVLLRKGKPVKAAAR